MRNLSGYATLTKGPSLANRRRAVVPLVTARATSPPCSLITVRASLSSRSPTNLECRRRSTYASYYTPHGVSHQITGPKTAPCRPGANDSATFKRCMQSSRRTRRNLDCCRIGRTMSHFEHHGCRECDRLPCFSSIKCGSQEVSL